MLRALVALLLFANLAFFAWTQGWLDGIVGVRADGDREPERLASQVHPENVVVLAATTSAAAAAARPSCLEAGPFTSGEAGAAEAALLSNAPGIAWTNLRTQKAGAWLVYMGGFADREARQRKEVEIRRALPEFEEISVPGEGAFGIALGRFDDRANADKALAQLAQHGIRTARVVQLNPPSTIHTLRIERADAALAAQLEALKIDALGNGFAACARGEAAR
jgi:hypothetical protein